ncbi:MAG: DUF5926 family protein [Gordonia sp. (in: high G+C Gram-positive bacteria)]
MAKKSKRGSGPRPGSNRAERVAARKARQAADLAAPARPFQGLAAECDLVAMRAFIASATAQVTFADGVDTANEADFATILPGAVPGLARSRDAAKWGERGAATGVDGSVTQALVALQTDPEPADLGGALASSLAWAVDAEPGSEFRDRDDAPALADVLDVDAPIEVVVYQDFTWWFGDDASVSPQIAAMLDRANETILPTTRLHNASGVGAPWWVDAGDRAHLRWVRPEDEFALMDALARLHADSRLTLGEGSRFAGSFRTHGLVVPVFDLDNEMHAEEWLGAVDQLDEWLNEALADTSDLTAAQRGSRAGIIGRQVTLR